MTTETAFADLTTTTACEECHASLPDIPSMDSVRRLLEGRWYELAKEEAQEAMLMPFVDLANTTLGALPDYSPDWRSNGACQAVSITTLEVDDTTKRMVEVEVPDGNGGTTKEKRYPKTLVRHVAIGAPIKVLTRYLDSTTSNNGTKGSARAVVVTKLLQGTTVWRKKFTTGTKAVAHEGLNEGKQGAPAYLSNYRINGVRYLVDYAEQVPDADTLPFEA